LHLHKNILEARWLITLSEQQWRCFEKGKNAKEYKIKIRVITRNFYQRTSAKFFKLWIYIYFFNDKTLSNHPGWIGIFIQTIIVIPEKLFFTVWRILHGDTCSSRDPLVRCYSRVPGFCLANLFVGLLAQKYVHTYKSDYLIVKNHRRTRKGEETTLNFAAAPGQQKRDSFWDCIVK